MARKSLSFKISARPAAFLAHLLFTAVTTLVLVWLLHFRGGLAFKSDNKEKILNVHTFLMTVGFILFGGEAIMAFKTIPASKDSRKALHLALHLTALLAGLVGVYTAFKFHNKSKLTDMVSLHSWLGIITVTLYGLQWLLGFFAYVFPGAELSRRASLLPWHIFLGMFIFLLAVCTAETGFMNRSSALRITQEGLTLNFTALLLLLFAAMVGLTVILPRS